MKKTKLFAFTLALIMGISAFSGCANIGGIQKEGATLELSMAHSWRGERTLKSVTHDPHFAVGTHLLCSKDLPNGGGTEYCWYDLETQTGTRFKPQCNEGLEPLERMDSAPIEFSDGTFGIVCMIYQGRGGGAFDIHRRCMEIYDENLNLIETRELPHQMFGDDYFRPKQTSIDKDGNWYVVKYDDSTQEYRQVIHSYQYKPGENGGEFLEYGVADPPSDMFNYMFTTADGTVYASYIQYDNKGNGYEKLYRLDAVNHSAEPAKLPRDMNTGEYIGGITSCATGTNGYDFYYQTLYGIYGVKGEETTQLVNWINSDQMYVYTYIPVDDGTFVVSDGDGYWHLTPRTQEEIDNTKLISLAAVDLDYSLLSAVMDYNRQETGYRIMVKDYGEYDTPDEPHKGYEVMKEDMMNGIIADMICADGQNFESLASKGLFADWYELMDADESFSREDYVQNFFEAYEYKDKLLRLGVNFEIMTSTAKTEYVGTEQRLSLGQQLDIPLQEGMDRWIYSPAETLADAWMRNFQTGTINRETAECYFDSPDFVKLLEELNRIPREDDFYLTMNDNYGFNYKTNWTEDRVLFNDLSISDPIAIRTIRRYYFGDADITLTGFPMVQVENIDRGNGGVFDTGFTVSINAQSAEKEKIWDFMKHLLSEDYQKKTSMPIHKGALDAKFYQAEHNITFKAFGEMFVGALEEWESDILRDYIEGVRTCAYYDYRVHDILMEEAEKMLAGDQTPQECAEMMQSRVSIYLSEQS